MWNSFSEETILGAKTKDCSRSSFVDRTVGRRVIFLPRTVKNNAGWEPYFLPAVGPRDITRGGKLRVFLNLPTGTTTESAWKGKKEKEVHSDFRLIRNIDLAL
jgi:hypothetical protein